MSTIKFPIGQLVATPNALKQISPDEIQSALFRHMNGDWGDVTEEDRNQNEFALKCHMRLYSKYHSVNGVRFYIITEWDRKFTTIQLREDY